MLALLPLDLRRLIWCEVGPQCVLMTVSVQWYKEVAEIPSELLVTSWLSGHDNDGGHALQLYLNAEEEAELPQTRASYLSRAFKCLVPYVSECYTRLARILSTTSLARTPSLKFFTAIQTLRHIERLTGLTSSVHSPNTAAVQDLFVLMAYRDTQWDTIGLVLLPLLGFGPSLLSTLDNIKRGDPRVLIRRTTPYKDLRLFCNESQTWTTVPIKPRQCRKYTPLPACLFATDVTSFHKAHPTLVILETCLIKALTTPNCLIEIGGFGKFVYSMAYDATIVVRHLIEMDRDTFPTFMTQLMELLLSELDALVKGVSREELWAMHARMVAHNPLRQQ